MAEQIPLKAVKSSGVATALAEYAAGDYHSPIYLPPIFTDYISRSGLGMTWVSATSISVSSGACYIPSLGYVLAFPAPITKSGLTLTANTWYHVYGYLNGSSPDIEIVTTAPASPFYGLARAKSGDNTRRYIGSVRTDGSGNVVQFWMAGETCYYASQQSALSNGQSDSQTSISLAALVPATATSCILRVQNFDSGAWFFLGNGGNAQFTSVSERTTFTVAMPLPANATSLSYQRKAAMSGSVGLDIQVFGFVAPR
ncbi:hypothetical protein [Xanthomonas sp. LMG 12461]|uniref:hypothetical protein n=1 Tax=Xanthomonas sp. LMG 12461 TaxID=2014543 RepID=UPI0012647C44|nr:hypothetical protein [Xanthomonas sp. LMG 12461]KAB7765406.1 hypothetical protein CEK68_11975 [Xanthomonas sp. LMG 12461]